MAASAIITGNRVEAMLRLIAASPSHLNVCLEQSVTNVRLTAAQGTQLMNAYPAIAVSESPPAPNR
jgi:arginine decarboxylase-like protein